MSTRAPAPIDVARIRQEFPLLADSSVVYLDTAATAQRPRNVIQAVADFYLHDNANVHRGLYELSRRATERFEAARMAVARFVGADDVAEVVFLRGATEAINLVASSWGGANLKQGDEIVLTVVEHHSNIVPWQMAAQRAGARLRYVDIDDEGRLELGQLEEYLRSGRVRMVAVGHVSNALGTIHPVRRIADLAHAHDALLFVDGAQGAPHLPVDVHALGCDFYALSGHKLCGPMGIGALWGRRELLEAMPPYMGGGEMIDMVYEDHSTWADLPHKFEAGTPNVAGAIGLAAAIEFLEGLGADAIQAHEHALVEHGMSILGDIEGLRVFGPRDPDERIAVFSFEMAGVHPHDVATILDEQGIAVRAGHHCAQLCMRRLNVSATSRASCYVYNSPADLDRLADGLEVARRIFTV